MRVLKAMTMILVLFGISLGGTSLAQDSELVLVPAQEIFVPNGYDDNDEVTVVVDGYFPDSCYRLAHNEVVHNPPEQRVQILQWARRYDSLCLMIQVPFWSEIRLGVMSHGDWQVATVGDREADLVVAEATNAGPDDFLYAPIESVRIEQSSGDRFAILEGRFTNTCMSIEEVRLINSGKTKEVLPIMAMRDDIDCEDRELPFAWRVDLPADDDAGRYLVHVRSLNGKAVNQVYSVY